MKQKYTTLCIATSAAIMLLASGCEVLSQRGQTQSSGHPTPATKSASSTDTVSSSYVPYYVKAPLTGYLRSIGSDSMDQVIADWEAELGRFHPGLRFRHEGKGSSTALPALLEQRSDIGPMSRALKAAEIASFNQKFGYNPTQLPVAIDSLAVYVHPDNPILKTGLSLKQIANIFSESNTKIERWGQLGLSGKWTNAPIRLHGRNPASGTYAFFKSTALNKQDFSNSLTEHPGSADLVDAVANDPYSIGYSGIAYSTPEVAAVSLQTEAGQYVEANQNNAVRGIYPLTRSLYVTLNIDPSVGPSDLQKEFLRFAFSREGQLIVNNVGYFPIAPKDARNFLETYN